MKKFLFIFTLMTSVLVLQGAPANFDDRNDFGDFKKPHHPVVPEPSTYGAIFLGATSLMVGYRKWKNRQ